jgi:hypothetical protein
MSYKNMLFQPVPFLIDQIPANKKVLNIDDFGAKRGYIGKMHD